MGRILNIILGGMFLALFAGCLRLDSNLFNAVDIEGYALDDYAKPEDWSFVLDASYDIPDSLVHLMTLPSLAPGETESTTIHALYIGDTARIATDTVIVYCHGNYAHMDIYWQRAKLLANVGGKNRFGVMMMDYRGYGLSDGLPTEEGMYADVDACLGWLQSKGLQGERLMMYGFSLGTAPAVELTAHPRTLRPAWLVTEAPFASAQQMATSSSGLFIPGSYFTDLKIDNEVEIQSVQQPFLWLHGKSDDYLDYETHGQVVFDHYQGSRGVAIGVEGANHSDVPAVMGLDVYRSVFLDFITTP